MNARVSKLTRRYVAQQVTDDTPAGLVRAQVKALRRAWLASNARERGWMRQAMERGLEVNGQLFLAEAK